MNTCGDNYILRLGRPHADGLNKAWRWWRVWTWYNARRIKTSMMIAALMLLWLSIQWPLRCRTVSYYQNEAKMWPLPSSNRIGRVPFHNPLLVAVCQTDSETKRKSNINIPDKHFCSSKYSTFIMDWLTEFSSGFVFNWISKEFHHPKQRMHLTILKNFPRRGFQGEDFLRRFCLKYSFLSWALPSHPRTSELPSCFLPFHICCPQQEIDTAFMDLSLIRQLGNTPELWFLANFPSGDCGGISV